MPEPYVKVASGPAQNEIEVPETAYRVGQRENHRRTQTPQDGGAQWRLREQPDATPRQVASGVGYLADPMQQLDLE